MLLVLCPSNSARSQMMEGWLRHHAQQAGLVVEVHSAGTEATHVNPDAITVMGEAGIDLSRHASKRLDELPDPRNFALVLTVCDQAAQACPTYPATTTRLHAGVPDPSGKDLPYWRETRDTLRDASQRLVHALAQGRRPDDATLRSGRQTS
jgi:arsenate reductase